MKKRIDVLLVEKGFFSSREQARRNLMAGNVLVDNQKVDKAGTTVNVDSEIRVKEKLIPYVSRGGLKLEKALQNFDLSVEGRVCMDIGASTGGFTDCMLQNGAKKVYAVDVGYGQLAWKLREDDRVVCMERQNIRHLDKNMLEELPEFLSIDVSFISLKLVLPKVWEISEEKSRVVALIKPQFEAGKEKVGKKGVVRDPQTHTEVIEKVTKIAVECGFKVLDLDFSPVRGPEGNIEYLIYLEKTLKKDNEISIDDVEFEKTLGHDEIELLEKGQDYDVYQDIVVKLVEKSHSLSK
ncbi:TlyA family RNA methyltransferase [Peptostreptococcus faecalis]|uniref:TlyA family RNA methyltransferase n=1 Tax=Peptostreptococcus faecalis TaxID=2045015 RepID=UPI000C7BE5F3|nr:TlyA family RNA methyltransferase [Peptostreptococcus faecalis]